MSKASVFLLVEPSPILRPILSRWIEDVLTDSHVLVATNGGAALELAVSEKPLYVLVKISLLDQMDFELVYQLRLTLPKSRIIATSWFEGRWFRDEIQWVRADESIPKHDLRDKLFPFWGIPKK